MLLRKMLTSEEKSVILAFYNEKLNQCAIATRIIRSTTVIKIFFKIQTLIKTH